MKTFTLRDFKIEYFMRLTGNLLDININDEAYQKTLFSMLFRKLFFIAADDSPMI